MIVYELALYNPPPFLCKKYSLYVRLMKIVLPVGIVLAVVLSFAWPYLSSLPKEEGLPKVENLIEIKENRMVKPQYTSTDDEGRPYSITADWAKQRTDVLADLENPEGSIALSEGQTVQIGAQKGVYNITDKEISLTNNVTISSTDGHHVNTEKATISIDKKVINSNTSVKGKGPRGSLQGQKGFTLTTTLEGKKTLTLKGRSRVTINQKIKNSLPSRKEKA